MEPSRAFSHVGHQTTVDIARGRYATNTIAGQKRTIDETLLQTNRPQSSILADITNKLPRNEFTRPTVGGFHKRLSPSAIERNCILKEITVHTAAATHSEWSQRRAIAATPTPLIDPLLSLAHPVYNLPKKLVENFQALGVNSIYPWQSNCLRSANLLSGEGNLVYTAPTGGGKSLVADILMLKKVIEHPKKKAILVLPYVALVQEKLRWLRSIVAGVERHGMEQHKQSIWRERGDENIVRVVGFFGGSNSRVSWADMDIAVCTIEKANSLVNAAIDECTVGNLGVVVLDELHMVNDDHRGYLMELMATKLLSLEQNTQLIGMSATLPNTKLLATWLNAKYYISNYKPIPIEEHLVFDNLIYPAASTSSFYKTAVQLNSQSSMTQPMNQASTNPEPAGKISPSRHNELKSSLVNAVVSLACETAEAGYGALIFCSSRAGCELDAKLVAKAISVPIMLTDTANERRQDLLGDLRSTTTGLDPTLEKTIPFGVAFHHAGLTTEERDLVASAYDNGTIKVIVATCSLAAGINLPARRVILHGARMGADLVGPSMLRQMRGRAGRKGKDEVGETYLCCQKSDLEAVAELMEAKLPDIESSLSSDKRGIDRALLEVIATRLATSRASIDNYMEKTLLHHSMDKTELTKMVQETIEKLLQDKLIRATPFLSFEATLLGEAIISSSFSPRDGIFIHSELSRAVQAFVLDGDMHVLYTFTPVHSADAKINWMIFRKEMDQLNESGLRVLSFIGVKPALVNKFAQGAAPKETTPEEIELARIYQRCYTAFQLRDLCNEVPIHAVSKKYDIERGAVQTLAQVCHGFATGMIKFCQKMGWGALAAALDHMSDRLKAGAKADLLALARVTYVKSRTARTFWENGFKSVAALAAADPQDLLPVLMLAQPKKPRLNDDDVTRYQKKLLLKAEIITKSASKIWERLMQQEVEIDEE